MCLVRVSWTPRLVGFKATCFEPQCLRHDTACLTILHTNSFTEGNERSNRDQIVLRLIGLQAQEPANLQHVVRPNFRHILMAPESEKGRFLCFRRLDDLSFLLRCWSRVLCLCMQAGSGNDLGENPEPSRNPPGTFQATISGNSSIPEPSRKPPGTLFQQPDSPRNTSGNFPYEFSHKNPVPGTFSELSWNNGLGGPCDPPASTTPREVGVTTKFLKSGRSRGPRQTTSVAI